ncbi:hypothetical protein [Runella limosa]|uniref:hypothetical protein n=1 Tax=Runella limosa TaxID=370978 RepID=UPI000403C2EF|nr:hypothetical protein [Runella limosa]
MKKLLITTTLALSAGLLNSQTVFAQKFLQKIKEKAQAATESLNGSSSSRPTKALYEKQQADAAKTILEGKTITKDPYGLGGIYYTRELFVCGSETNNLDKAIGKFLVTFEKETNAVKLKLTPSYEAEGVSSLVLGRNDYPADLVLKVSSAIKQPRFDAALSHGTYYGFYAKHTLVENGTVVKDTKETLRDCSVMHIVLIEPGVLLMTNGSGLYYIPKGGRTPEDIAKEKLDPVAVLYTKEKESKAKSLTDEQLYDLLVTHQKAFQKRYDLQIDGQKEAFPEIDAANAPSFSGNSKSTSTNKDKPAKAVEKTIRIELQNLTSEDVYYTVNGMSKMLQRIGSKFITGIVVKPGVTIVTKNGRLIATITESTKPSTRFKIE